ncbi:FixH family protein [Paenibacillus dendritiformis]|uniref:FixH family protein n=1 Tax=Paenibacillus dendritiformis TaxID=130049 RepID=UPI0018CD7B02|nr:FixH family protein [Paenibacillus dendritiformis]
MSVKKRYALYASALLASLLLTAVGYAWKSAAGFEPVTRAELGTVQAQLELGANPAAVLQRNELRIKLQTADGSPVRDARIAVELAMPAMLCGTYQVKLEQTEPGIYAGEAVPLMPGTWQAEASFELDDGTFTAVHRFEAAR